MLDHIRQLLSDRRPRVMVASSVNVDPAWMPVIVAFVLLVVLVAVAAGVFAVVLAERKIAFVPSIVAGAALTIWVRVRLGVDGHTAVMVGFGAVVAVGLAMRQRRLDDSSANRRRRRPFDVVVVAIVLIGSVVAFVSARSHQVHEKSLASTRGRAESAARILKASPGTGGRDMAFAIASQNVEVLTAEGDRRQNGADLTAYISHDQYGTPILNQCWHFHLVGDESFPPEPIRWCALCSEPGPQHFG